MIPRKHIPHKLRERVRNKFEGRCGYCGEEKDRISIDHIEPVSKESGEDCDREENLMPSCHSCNNYKHAWDLETFRKNISEQTKLLERCVNWRIALRYG